MFVKTYEPSSYVKYLKDPITQFNGAHIKLKTLLSIQEHFLNKVM